MKIAIQGHQTRGKEVIQILESLSGINILSLLGSNINCYYYIQDNNIRIIINTSKISDYKLYTLEEFEKEFPFKVGDRVVSLTTGLIGTITKFFENGIYHFKYDNGISSFASASYLKLYKEMKEERNITLTLDKAKEWYKKGGELKEIALQAFTEKELTKVYLPKTWEEFCKQGNPINSWRYNIPTKYEALHKLELLRDCYRGLFITIVGMPVRCIIRQNGKLIICQRKWGDETFLSFQSLEVAKEYLDNFEPLIKQAGDLI